jgi:hypothetical protein
MYMLHRNMNRSEIWSLILSSTIHSALAICCIIFLAYAAVIFACI